MICDSDGGMRVERRVIGRRGITGVANNKQSKEDMAPVTCLLCLQVKVKLRVTLTHGRCRAKGATHLKVRRNGTHASAPDKRANDSGTRWNDFTDGTLCNDCHGTHRLKKCICDAFRGLLDPPITYRTAPKRCAKHVMSVFRCRAL